MLCVLNEACQGVRAARDMLAASLAAANVPILAAKPGDIPARVRDAIARGADVIIAAGGDGTVSAVAAVLAGTQVALGVLPLGTLNHFAKDLGIPLALDEALATIAQGRRAQVDVGAVNGRTFVNNSSLGLYPWIVREREARRRHGTTRLVAFLLAIFAVLRGHRGLTVRMDGVDGAGVETPFVFVGNNRYEIAGLHIGVRARLDDGHLWVCRAPRASRTGLLRMAALALLGRPPGGELETFETAALSIRTKAHHLSVAIDGEVVRMQAPLQYASRPRALTVIVPGT